MGTTDSPQSKTRRKTKLPIRPVLLVALAATGLFAGTALPNSTSGTEPAAAAPIIGQHALVGVNPGSLVIQRGSKNYAGPNCPGEAWTCTNAQYVMQVGTQNTFECQPEPAPTFFTNTDVLQECVIDQTGENNTAKCVQKKKTVPFVRQRCSITQTGQHNQATIVQVIEQTGGPIQGAVQEAGISQDTTGGTNQLQVDQEIKQTTTDTTTDTIPTGKQEQDAYQVVSGPFGVVGSPGEEPTDPATQTAEGAGNSAPQVDQKQIQRAEGGTTLTQNDGVTLPLFTAPADCNDAGFFSPENPNVCANLEQETDSGDNQSQLTQAIDDEGVGATALPASQTQGFLEGGLDGRVHQETGGSSSSIQANQSETQGSSSNQANQSETQKLFAAPGSTQAQFGPGSCCGFGSQIGPGSEQIAQKALQEASEDDAAQVLTLVGTSDNPDGTCATAHDAKNNGAETSESFSFVPCFPPPIVTTTCASGPPPSEGPAATCTTVATEFD